MLDGYDEQSQPEGPDGDPLDRVPNAVLIDIGRGLVEAKAAAAATAQAEQTAAEKLIAAL